MEVIWIPGQGMYSNSYVIGNILVDAGVFPMAIEKYADDIDTIVLTHSHFDHIARLKDIAAMCRARIYIHEQDAEGLSNSVRNLSHLFGERFDPIVPDDTLAEGDIIEGLVVLHTPGHTPGSICLFSRNDKFLISGDTVFSDGGFGRYDFPGGDREALKRSIARLAELDVESIHPGHGAPVRSNGTRHIKAALAIISMDYY